VTGISPGPLPRKNLAHLAKLEKKADEAENQD